MGRKKVEKEEDFELDFDNVVAEKEQVDVEPKTLNEVVDYGSEKWNDFIMSQFQPYELLDGKYPKCSALRRVGLFLGPTVFSGPVREYVNTNGKEAPRATVVYQLTINWRLNIPVQFIDFKDFQEERTFAAIADCDYNNTEDEYAVHSAAMAETRAEARCWRKALLISMQSAEEMQSPDNAAEVVKSYKKTTDNEIGEERDKENITSMQFRVINEISERLSVDLDKRLKYEINGQFFKEIKDLKIKDATTLISELNGYQSDKVPEQYKKD